MSISTKLSGILVQSKYFMRIINSCGVRAYSLQNVNDIVKQESLENVSPLANDYTRMNALEKASGDLSEIITPYFSPSFNLAAYVNNSEVLQALFHLDVDLSKFDKKPHVVHKILRLDLENDVNKHVMFLKDYLSEDEMGKFITKNPLILCEPLDDLNVRVNYLMSKSFSDQSIKRIITANPFWLMFSTIRIDRRLGFFQEYFDLTGRDVRSLATKMPKLITYNLHLVKTNTFAIKEEMGFNDKELKHLLLSKPKILMLNHMNLVHRFNYIHNTMKIDHEMILKYPEVLLSRTFRIKQRHMFLQNLGRAQYDPNKENYVPIMALAEGTDSDFCLNYAKCCVDSFNVFLKTM